MSQRSLSSKREQSHWEKDRLFSTLFTVPKKGGEHRLIINLKWLNRFIPRVHFKIDGIPSLKDIVLSRDYMIKLDLKDPYFAIPIHPSHQRYLNFVWKDQTFQFTCQPFGLSSAPRTFTKVMKVPMAPRLLPGSLSGRYPHLGKDKGRSSEMEGYSFRPPREPRISHQLQKVGTDTGPVHSLSGFPDQHSLHGDQPSPPRTRFIRARRRLRTSSTIVRLQRDN